jgi:hypothetical protein
MTTPTSRTPITDWLRSNIFKSGKPLFMILPIVVCAIVVVVVVFIVSRIGVYTIDEPVYRFENGVKHQYTGTTEIKRDEENAAITLTNGGRSEVLENVPIYYEDDQRRILLPPQMVYVDPWTQRTGNTGYNAEVSIANPRTVVVSGKSVPIGEGFIYDGENTYIFLDPMTIEYGGKTIDLPPLSYAMVYYDLRIEIYTPDGETAIVEQTGPVRVNADSKDTTDGGYHVDLSMHIMRSKNGETLLITQPSLLDELSEYEPGEDELSEDGTSDDELGEDDPGEQEGNTEEAPGEE